MVSGHLHRAAKVLPRGCPGEYRRGRIESICHFLSINDVLTSDGKHVDLGCGVLERPSSYFSSKLGSSLSVPSDGQLHSVITLTGPSTIPQFSLPKALLFLPCPPPVSPVAPARMSHVVSGSRCTAQSFLYSPKLIIVCEVTEAVLSGNQSGPSLLPVSCHCGRGKCSSFPPCDPRASDASIR